MTVLGGGLGLGTAICLACDPSKLKATNSKNIIPISNDRWKRCGLRDDCRMVEKGVHNRPKNHRRMVGASYKGRLTQANPRRCARLPAIPGKLSCRAIHLALGVFLCQRLPFVVEFLAARNGDFDFDPAVAQVESERNDGLPFHLKVLTQRANLVLVEQQLAGACGLVIDVPAALVG